MLNILTGLYWNTTSESAVLGYVTGSLTEDHHFCNESQTDATLFVASRKKISLVLGETMNYIILACA